jgi:CubicO group peptidase (beta-lactamase class C family)
VQDPEAQAFIEELEVEVPALLDRHHVPGASLALVRHGEPVWAQGYGVADLDTQTPMTEETVFRVASISKAVTAWGVMTLVQEGEIELYGPVERYLTRWHFPPSGFDAEEVTIFRLLSHTAGLNVHGYGRGPQPRPLPSLEESLTNTGVQIIQEPGSGFLYSGGGYTVLQLMIEEVTGQPFAEYMQEQILDPLGMRRSSFYDAPAVLSRMATGYDEDWRPYPARRFTEQAAAGLYATAPDLARFVAAGLQGAGTQPPGRGVLEPKTLELMYAPAPTTDGGYGLGYQTSFDRTPIVLHSGDNPGWETIFVALPELGEGIVCLTNGDTGEAFNAELVQFWSAWLTRIYTN